MQLLDVARRKMLHQQHLLKEAELHRLDDEIRKKVRPTLPSKQKRILRSLQADERKDVLDSGIKSAELKSLELETQTKILENVKLSLSHRFSESISNLANASIANYQAIQWCCI